MSLTEQQRENRLNYITGSDAAIICGVSKWGNIIDLWREKLRLKEREEIDQKLAEKGKYLEPAIAQWFADKTGKELIVHEDMIVHPTIPFWGGHVDRLVKNERAIFEAKTANYADGWGEQGDDIIPDYYLCQVAHYVAAADAERGYTAVLIGGMDFRHYVYERNIKLEEMMTKKAVEFWDCVKNEVPPEPRTPDEVVSLYTQALYTDPLIVNEEIENAIRELQVVKEALKSGDIERKRLETMIKAYMKEHEMLHDRSGKPVATWRNRKGAVRFDAQRLCNENHALYEQYLKQDDPTRTFLLKGK